MALPDEQTTTVGSVQRPWTKKKTSLKTLPQAQHGPGEASAEALQALSRLSDNRDDSERLLASDGYPIGGLAKIHEICVATGISKSNIFDLIDTGELPSRRFGRTVRVLWTEVRAVFF